MANSYDYLPGQLNPASWPSRAKAYNSSMILDDRLACHRQSVKAAVQPNLFSDTMIVRGVVLASYQSDIEKTPLFNLFSDSFGASPRSSQTPSFLCMVPELDGHLVNPLLCLDPDVRARMTSRYSVYTCEDYENAAGIDYRAMTPGSIVEIEYFDEKFQHGVIRSLVKSNQDPNPPEYIKSAIELHNSQDWPRSAAFLPDLGTITGIPYDPSLVTCSGNNFYVSSRILLTERLAAAVKIIGAFMPDDCYATSAVRSSEGQKRIIMNYAARHNIECDGTVEGVEKARLELKDLGYLIGQVVWDPPAPDPVYYGHGGGGAVDISSRSATMQQINSAVQTAAAYVPGLTIDMTIIEEVNGCVHIQVGEGTYYDPDELYNGWQLCTGCSEDPNTFPHVAASKVNFKMTPPPPGNIAEPTEGSKPENSDQQEPKEMVKK